MPDVHGPEVGPGGIFEPDAVDDGHLAIVVHLLKRAHVGVKSQLVVDGQDLVLGDVYLGPVVPVFAAGVRDYRVENIVGSGKLQNDHHRVFLG